MAKRTDIHRPSAINPEEYDYIISICLAPKGLGELAVNAANQRALWAFMESRGASYSKHEHGGNCHVCGAHAVYLCAFYHEKTNSVIFTGEDCARKMDLGQADLFRQVKALRDELGAAREAKAGKARAEKFLESVQMERAWEIYQAGWYAECPNGWALNKILSIIGKLVRYGSLSEAQVNFVRNLIEKIDNAEKVNAERDAEHAAAAPVPDTEKRITFEGEIISTKVVDTYYGSTVKMLVKTDEGWKVWGTCPDVTELFNGAKGFRIRFQARVTRSNDDPKFGFFKRPTKVEVLGKVGE